MAVLSFVKLVDKRYWLTRAKCFGYDVGFIHSPTPVLLALEVVGLIERNPTTSDKNTQWRVTELGLNTDPDELT